MGDKLHQAHDGERRKQPDSVEVFFARCEKGLQVLVTEEEKEKYGLLMVGPVSEKDLDIRVSSPDMMKPNKTEQQAKDFLKSYVDRYVEQFNAEQIVSGRRPATRDPKVNASKVERQADGRCLVELQTDFIDYGDFIALGSEERMQRAYDQYMTQASFDGVKLSFIKFSELFRPRPIGTCALIFTADDHILLAKRHSDKTGIFSDAYHLPAGYLEEGDLDERGQINPFVAIRREIEEEVGLTAGDLQNIFCLGAVLPSNPALLSNIEFVFVARTRLNKNQIVDERATNVRERLLLHPQEIEGDIKAKRIVDVNGKLTGVLWAMLKLDQVYGSGSPDSSGGRLTVPQSEALFFLVNKALAASPVR